jgi:D-proline reductase (dithiol) PrdB
MFVETKVDSYRFITGLTGRMVKNWIKMETPRPIPWTPLSKPLAECTVALISSGAIALKTDAPFDQDGERENPWWGDPSYRIIPQKANSKDINVYHLHVNPRFAEQDLNCLFPLERLLELAESGEIGRSAPSHYSYMGYILEPQTLLEESVPAIIRQLKEDQVEVVVLVPA